VIRILAGVLLVVLVSGCAPGSYRPAPDILFAHKAIVFVPGADASEVYHRARMYLARTFVSSTDVIQYASEEHGRIIGRGMTRIPIDNGFVSSSHNYLFLFDMQIVDGKLRVYFDDFYKLIDGVRFPARFEYEVEPIREAVNAMVAEMRSELGTGDEFLEPESLSAL
tara:strand:- start:749 stop:1249 length:501 start_codon:yes stop_codon:yes gene_type:complete